MSGATTGKRWAVGMVVTTSGLAKEEKLEAQRKINQAGGDYSPNLSRRCTHVLTRPGTDSQKLDAIRNNPQLWPQAIISMDWLTACESQQTCLPPGRFAVKQRAPEVRKPLGSRQQPLGTQQREGQASGEASARCMRAQEPATAITTATGTCLAARPTVSSRQTSIQPTPGPAATPWVLQPATFIKAEAATTGTKLFEAWHPTPGPSAVAVPPAAPASVTTAHKPAPWRVHFSQAEDPLSEFHAAAPTAAITEVQRRTWRVRVSSIPEDHPRGPGPTPMTGAAAADAEPLDKVAQLPQLTEEDDGGGAGGVLPPAKPWYVQHVQEPPTEDIALPAALQLHISGVAAAAEPSRSRLMSTHGDRDTEAASATVSSSRGAHAGALPAAACPLQDRWTQGSSQSDGLPMRHPAAMALLEALASPRSSQGSVLGSLVPAAQLAGLEVPLVAATTSWGGTRRSLESTVPGGGHSIFTNHVPQDRTNPSDIMAGVSLNKSRGAGTGPGQRTLVGRVCTFSTNKDRNPSPGGAGGTMATLVTGTSSRTEVCEMPMMGEQEAEPPFPSLTQLAADLHALRQDFIVIPDQAEAAKSPSVTTIFPRRPNEHQLQQGQLPRSQSPSYSGLLGAAGGLSVARQRPAEEVAMNIGVGGGIGGCSYDISPDCIPEMQAVPGDSTAGRFHVYSADGERAENNTAEGQLNERRKDWMGGHSAEELPYSRCQTVCGPSARAQQAGTDGEKAAARVLQAGNTYGDEGRSGGWAPALSQLAAELREARQVLGEGGHWPPAGEAEVVGQKMLERLEPPPTTTPALFKATVPGSQPEQECSGDRAARHLDEADKGKYGIYEICAAPYAEQLSRAASAVILDAYGRPFVPATGIRGSGGPTGPFVIARDAGTNITDERWDEDHYEADIPGPMTQLVAGMREAREELQMGYGGYNGAAEGATCEQLAQTHDEFSALQQPPLAPLACAPLPERAPEEEAVAAYRGPQDATTLQPLVELWGLNDCAALDARSVPQPLEGLASPGPGKIAAHQGPMPSFARVGQLPGGLDSALSGVVPTLEAAAIVAGGATGDSYLDTTAERSLTQLIQGLQQAREELRSPEHAKLQALAPTGGVATSSHLYDSFRTNYAGTAPGQCQLLMACDLPEVPRRTAQAPRGHADAAAVPCSLSDDGPGEKPLSGPEVSPSGDGNGGADDEISFSQLVRLLNQQKLSRTVEAGGNPDKMPALNMEIHDTSNVDTRSPLVVDAQSTPSNAGTVMEDGLHSPDWIIPGDNGPGACEKTSYEDEGPSLDDDRAYGYGSRCNDGDGSVEWEPDPEASLKFGVGPSVMSPPRQGWGAGNRQSGLAEAPAIAHMQVLQDRSALADVPADIPVVASPTRVWQQASSAQVPAVADILAGSNIDYKSHLGRAPPTGEKRRERDVYAVATAAAVTVAAATPLPSQSQRSSNGVGAVWTAPGAVLGDAQSENVGSMTPSPSPSPSPDLRPADLLARFGPTLLSPRGAATVTETALTTADSTDMTEQKVDDGGKAGYRDPSYVTAARAPGPSSSCPLCPGENTNDLLDPDVNCEEGLHTPIAAAPDFSFLVSIRNGPQCSCSNSASIDGGCSGSGPCGNRDGGGGSKPAARKMDSRTPTLLSTQGRRKLLQPRRSTPISMKAPLPTTVAVMPAAPGCKPQADSQKIAAGLLPIAVASARTAPWGERKPSVAHNLQQGAVHCKPEPDEACTATGFIVASSLYSHQNPQPAPTILAATEAAPPAAVDPPSLSQGHQFYADQNYQSQQTAPNGSQRHGLMALLRPPVIDCQDYGCSQRQSQGLSALLLSSQPPGCAIANLPVLKPEEIHMRRSQMPWAAVRSPQVSLSRSTWGPDGHQMPPTAIGTAGAAAGVGEDAMPITPGPWLEGEESDDEVLDLEALVKAGRAAAGLKTPLSAASWVAAVDLRIAGSGGTGVCLAQGRELGTVGVAMAAKAEAKEAMFVGYARIPLASESGPGIEPERQQLTASAIPSTDVRYDSREQWIPASSDAAGISRQLQQQQQQPSGDSSYTTIAQRITVQDVAAAAVQSPPHDSQSPPRSADSSQLQARPQAFMAVRSSHGYDHTDFPTLDEATATLGSLGLAGDVAEGTEGLNCANPDGRSTEGDLNAAELCPSQQRLQHEEGPVKTAVRVSAGVCDSGFSSSGGLLEGALVIIDRLLPREQAETCAATVEALGGRISSSTHLGCGATAVVCEQSWASRWLAWGAHLLSPRSLQRLPGGPSMGSAQLKEVSQASAVDPFPVNLLCMSRGIVHALQRRLDDVVEPDEGENRRWCQSKGSGPGGSSSVASHGGDRRDTVGQLGGAVACGTGTGDGGASTGDIREAEDPWPTLEARKQFLISLKASEAAAGTGLQGLGLAGDQPSALQPVAPLALLENLVWTLTEPPHHAQVAHCIPLSRVEEDSSLVCDRDPDGDSALNEDSSLMPTDEDLGVIEGLRADNGGCGLGPERNASLFQQGQAATWGGEPRLVGPEDLDAVVFTGPCLTLLLPQDQHGLLGHHAVTVTQRSGVWHSSHISKGSQGRPSMGDTMDARCKVSKGGSSITTNGRGITVRDLLVAVHQHYAQHMAPLEVAAAMSSHPVLRRELQVAWQQGTVLPRSALLGRKVVLCGLRRCSLAGSIAVYELHLMG